jgi:acetylcholinesterase
MLLGYRPPYSSIYIGCPLYNPHQQQRMNILAICISLAASSISAAPVSETPQVQLGNTTLVGRTVAGLQQEFFGGQFTSFHYDSLPRILLPLGIPYAQPPIGNLRFSPPIPLQSINASTFDASNFGFACLQSVL